MPRLFRNRIGTTKLSLFVMSVAALTLFCFAAVPSASAQTSLSFYMNIEDSNGDAVPNNAVLVTVTLNPDGVATDNSKKATVTFTAEKIGTTQYYLDYAIINVNGTVTGGSPTVTAVVSGTPATGTPTYSAATGDALDGFGFGATTGLESVTNPGSDASKSITFTLTSTTAWTSDSTVLLKTSGAQVDVDAGAKIGTSTSASSDSLDAGGLEGENVPPTPEPTSYLLFGSGLLLLGVISRKKLGLGRD